MLEKFKKIWASIASKIPNMKAAPTDRYGFRVYTSNTYRSTIPKNPTAKILRGFAKTPVVAQPIDAVRDRITRMKYEIRPKVAGRKYTKQIRVVRNIIDNPNIDQTRRKFEAMLIADMLVLDAGCFEVCKSDDPNHPLYLYPVDGATVQHVIPMDYTNPFAYKYMQSNNDGNVYFRRDEMCYMARSQFTDKPYGLSPVLKAYDSIRYFLDGLDSASENVNIKTADMAIDLGEEATTEMVEKLREYMANEIEGTGKIPIIGGTKNAKTMQIRSFTADNLYLNWENFLITLIANAFPYPVEKLINVSADRSTTEDFETRIIEELVKPYAILLEDAYNTHVINALGYGDILEFHYVFEDSEDMKTKKWNRLNNAYVSGTITENEVRAAIGFEKSASKYADLTSDERKAVINKELGVNGFNGLGDVKDTSNAKNSAPRGGDSGG